MEKDIKASATDEWIPTVCYMCYSHCGIKVRKANGLVVDIKGDEANPHSLGKVCAKAKAAIMGLYDPSRTKKPLKRTNPQKGIGVDPKWQEISWEEALTFVADRLRKIRQEDPRKLVFAGLDFGHSYYQAAFQSAFGTHNWVHAPGYFCGNVLHLVHYLMEGSFFAEPDYSLCNYCLLVGSEEGFMVNKNSTRMAQRMADARARGMRVVVVNPVCTNGASKADEWVPIRPGTDGAFALAFLNLLLNELGAYDSSFIKRYTTGPYLVGGDGLFLRMPKTGKPLAWDTATSSTRPYDMVPPEDAAIEGEFSTEFGLGQPAFQLIKAHVKKYGPEEAAQITTIPAETIYRLAQEFAQAARIGSTIVIEGKELPLRPAALQWTKGSVCHKHGSMVGLALQLINTVVGAVDVPGGLLGNKTVGPYWRPQEGPDGILMPAASQIHIALPYPGRKAKAPETVDLKEFFPVGSSTHPMFEEGMARPEKYFLPYRPEMMLHINSNIMMTTSNPKGMAEALSKIPFLVSCALYIDETVEWADIVLPDAHFLERLLPFPNYRTLGMVVGPGQWYWPMAQPVVEPANEARPWNQVLVDLAARAGFISDFNMMLNLALNLKEPYKLELDIKYQLPEIADRWAQSWFGQERGLDWFKQHGVITFPKKVEETYPRPFFTSRIPIYLEHFQKAGQDLKKVTRELGLDWDTSDYQPLPDWKPCPAYEMKEQDYDLYAVNYKTPIHTFSFTAQNPWLDELAQHHPYAYKILINSEVAKRKEIKEDDFIWVESNYGRVKGRAKPTEGIHPEVVGIAGVFGHWAKGMPVARGKGAHFNSLLSAVPENIDMVAGSLDACVKVKVSKA